MDSFSIQIKPIWDDIDKASDELDKFLEKKDLSTDTRNALFMVSNELLENAIKYGSFRKNELITCNAAISKKEVIIEVVNHVNEQVRSHLKKLDQTIQWIRGYQNPFQAYVERMKEVSVKALDDLESGLGLVRIAYEGKCILDFFVNEENMLAVSALLPLQGK